MALISKDNSKIVDLSGGFREKAYNIRGIRPLQHGLASQGP